MSDTNYSIGQASTRAEFFAQNQLSRPVIPQNLDTTPSLSLPQTSFPFGIDPPFNGPAQLHHTQWLPAVQSMRHLLPFAPNLQTSPQSEIGRISCGSITQHFRSSPTYLLQMQNRMLVPEVACLLGQLPSRVNLSAPTLSIPAPSVPPVSSLPGPLGDAQIATALDLITSQLATSAHSQELSSERQSSGTSLFRSHSGSQLLENFPPTDIAMRTLLDPENATTSVSSQLPESTESSESSEFSESFDSSEAAEPALPDASPIAEETSPLLSEDNNDIAPAIAETTESQLSSVDDIVDPENEKLTQMSHLWPFTNEQVVAIHFCKYAVLKVGLLASNTHAACALQQKLKTEIRRLWVQWVRGLITRYEFTISVMRFAEEDCMPIQKFNLLPNFLVYYKQNVKSEWDRTMDSDW